MSLIELLLHALNFAAPAVMVAAISVLCSRIVYAKSRPLANRWLQLAINFAVGLSALLLGLWVFGTDGKLATYSVLVVGCGTVQWLLMRAWQLK